MNTRVEQNDDKIYKAQRNHSNKNELNKLINSVPLLKYYESNSKYPVETIDLI